MNLDMKKIVEAVMTDRAGAPAKGVDVLLQSAAKLYGAAVAVRSRLYDRIVLNSRTLPCKVVSLGNITVGGTGKTPMTIFLADSLKQKHIHPVVLSRGYGGTATDSGGMVTDGYDIYMDSSSSGDEPYLMASLLKGVPVFVGKKRSESAMEAFSRFHPDVFILDDGFQHRAVHRDVDIILLDAKQPFGNGFLLPRGVLREPVSNLERADLFVLTRVEQRDRALGHFSDCLKSFKLSDKVMNTPVFTCRHSPVVRGILRSNTHALEAWCPGQGSGDLNVFAFSGIAKNDEFRKSLGTFGFLVKGFLDFPDHHVFNAKDFQTVISKADSQGAKILTTTEKDFARLRGRVNLPYDLVVIGVDIDFGEDESGFLDEVCRRLG